jgi:hypothetical protein
MHHHVSVSAVEVEWTFVSPKRPCVVCAGADGCRRGFEDEFAVCTQVASEWPLSAGGWVHRVGRSQRAETHDQPDPSAAAREDTAPAASPAQ